MVETTEDILNKSGLNSEQARLLHQIMLALSRFDETKTWGAETESGSFALVIAELNADLDPTIKGKLEDLAYRFLFFTEAESPTEIGDKLREVIAWQSLLTQAQIKIEIERGSTPYSLAGKSVGKIYFYDLQAIRLDGGAAYNISFPVLVLSPKYREWSELLTAIAQESRKRDSKESYLDVLIELAALWPTARDLAAAVLEEIRVVTDAGGEEAMPEILEALESPPAQEKETGEIPLFTSDGEDAVPPMKANEKNLWQRILSTRYNTFKRFGASHAARHADEIRKFLQNGDRFRGYTKRDATYVGFGKENGELAFPLPAFVKNQDCRVLKIILQKSSQNLERIFYWPYFAPHSWVSWAEFVDRINFYCQSLVLDENGEMLSENELRLMRWEIMEELKKLLPIGDEIDSYLFSSI